MHGSALYHLILQRNANLLPLLAAASYIYIYIYIYKIVDIQYIMLDRPQNLISLCGVCDRSFAAAGTRLYGTVGHSLYVCVLRLTNLSFGHFRQGLETSVYLWLHDRSATENIVFPAPDRNTLLLTIH